VFRWDDAVEPELEREVGDRVDVLVGEVGAIFTSSGTLDRQPRERTSRTAASERRSGSTPAGRAARACWAS
jgi:hypothetical protein